MLKTTSNKSLIDALMIGWLLLGAVVLISSLTPLISGDGEVRLHDVIRFYRHDDIPRTQFSAVQPFLSVPLYWLGTLIYTPEIVTAWFNCLIFVVFLCCLYPLISDRTLRFFSFVLLLSTTMFPHYLKGYDGEMLTSCAVTLGFFYLVERRLVLSSFLLTIGVAQTPATFPAFALALCFLALKTKNSKIILLILLPMVAIVAETYLKHGSLLNNPYLAGNRGVQTVMPYSSLPGFSYPFFLGLISIIFSFGKGLIFFIPAIFFRLFISFKDVDKKIALIIDVLLIFVLGMALTYSKWWAWYGGVSWGPRFFLIACIPASLILAAWLSQKRETNNRLALGVLTLVFSTWVCVQGYLYGGSHLELCTQNNYAQEFMCWYVPEFSPIFRQFVTTFDIKLSLSQQFFITWCGLTLIFCIFYKLLTHLKKQLS
jgi:hypothetical protein